MITAEDGQEALGRLGEIHEVVFAENKMPSMIRPQVAKRASESRTRLWRGAFIGQSQLASGPRVSAVSVNWYSHREIPAGPVESDRANSGLPKNPLTTGLSMSLLQPHADAGASAAARTRCLI